MPNELIAESLFEAGQTLLIAIAAGLYVDNAAGQSLSYQILFSLVLLSALVAFITILKLIRRDFDNDDEEEMEPLQFGM